MESALEVALQATCYTDMAKSPAAPINLDLEGSIKTLVQQTLASADASLDDKLAAIDRAIKWEELKIKKANADEEFGSAFNK